jgi:hypothetical protein
VKLQHTIQPRTENDMAPEKKIARRKLSLEPLRADRAVFDPLELREQFLG